MSNWFESKWNEVTSGANTAPTPQVNSSPPPAPLAKTWQSPDVSHPGHIQVNTSHLTTAADAIKARLPELDEAVNAVKQQMEAFSSLQGWQAAEQTRTRLNALVQQCVALGQEKSDVQTKAALDLSRSADEYREKEAATKKAFDSLRPAFSTGYSSGSGSASGGVSENSVLRQATSGWT